MINKIKLVLFTLTFSLLLGCEEKISESDLNDYKSVMDQRLGHLGNAIIMQGRLLDAFTVSYTHLRAHET